jgi:anti-sigma factor ChrR (cupin superfamily)
LDHPSEETLKRFAAGTASREESRNVVAHLLKGCAHCANRLKTLTEPRSVSGASYDDALDRFDQGMIEALETSISPVQTLRTILRGALPHERLDPKRRDEE